MKSETQIKRSSVLRGGTERVLRTKASRKIQADLVTLFAVMALVLLSGCASVPVQGNPDPVQYNPETGYPAVGGAWPWVFHL